MRHRVIVRAVSKKGFFRAGRFWPNEPVEVEVEQETVEVLVKEPHLVVLPVATPEPEPKARKLELVKTEPPKPEKGEKSDK